MKLHIFSSFRSLGLRCLVSRALLVTLPLQCLNGYAVETVGKAALGFNAQFASAVPAITLRYGFSRSLSLEGLAGFYISPLKTFFGVKGYKTLTMQRYLNLYAAMGLGFGSGLGQFPLQGLGAVGSEVFLPGLESLGFSFEVGLSFTSGVQAFQFQTMGSTFLAAGARIYL